MRHLFLSTWGPVLVLLGVVAACGSEGRRRSDRDDAGAAGQDDNGGDGAAGRVSPGGGDSGGAGRNAAGRAGSTGADSGAAGAPAGGESSGDDGGTGTGGSTDGGEGPDSGGSANAGDGAGGTGAGGSGAAGSSAGSAGSSAGSGGSGGGVCAIEIEPLSHHLGDGDFNEGTVFTRSFELDCACPTPYLSFQMDGPSYESAPRVYLNNVELPTLQTFYPAISSADVWQVNTSTHDYNGYLQIQYPVSELVVAGVNTFTIQNGTAADDYNFQDVRLECGAPSTPRGPDIVTRGSWVGYYDDRAGDDPLGIQGAFYAYGDGVSCTVPSAVCSSGACCISGTTLASLPDTNWGCGMGLQLHSTGGDPATELVYDGPADCFDVELTGTSGGSDVILQAPTHSDMTGRSAAVYAIGPVASTTKRTVCFSDFQCPSDADKPCEITGDWYKLEVNVVGAQELGGLA